MSPIADADWKRYEKQIEARLRAKARGPVTITANTTLPGRISGVDRQIDILVDGQFSGITSMKMIVDCKCWSTKVDVKHMESFIGMVQDVGVQAGMLITTMGVTPAAAQRGAHILTEVVPLIEVAVFDEPDEWWLNTVGTSGTYVGEYVDHEPYGKFWWVVEFRPSGEDDGIGVGLWSSSEGGWDGEPDGRQILANVLARHRLGAQPSAEDLAVLIRALERNVDDGQGFYIDTSDLDDWLAGSEEPDD